jgi:putative FmdB family regulatory protein
MPIYEYRCSNGHTFETMQSINDEPLGSCEVCGAPAERVLSPVAVHFKGSGFYTTDYGRKKGKKAGGDGGSEGKDSGSKSESKSDSKKPDAKSATKD